MPNTISLNELRASFTAPEEIMDQMKVMLLDQIKDAASSNGDMDLVQHLAKQVDTLSKGQKALNKIGELSANILVNTLGFSTDSDEVSEVGLRTLVVEVTQGMINQHLLTLTDARRNGRVSVGEKFTITLPDGASFTTDLCDPGNKLRERGQIRKFYVEAGIAEGDKVILKETAKGNWRLIAGNSEEGARLLIAVHTGTYGMEPGELESMLRQREEEEAEARKAVEEDEKE